jgi:thiamine pyrophosphokinase
MRDGTLHLNGKVGAAAGIFGFPHAVVSSSGLQWDLKESPLELGGFQSSSNYLIQEEVILQIQGDALISFPEVPFRKKSGLKNKK